MEIIVSHNNTDFDGLASMIAANKIYPDAELVYVGKLNRNVTEFMALHKDTFSFKQVRDIPLQVVSRLILVDTKNPNRIGEVRAALQNKGIQIHIFDHHPRNPEDLSGDFEIIDQIGSATTLLIEVIRERGLEINSFEATVFALGIYEDTDCLTFGTTTPRDAAAVAYLLSKGAKLSVVEEFIDRPISNEQKLLLNNLIVASQTFDIAGVKILLASAEIPDYIGGLSLLTHKLGEIVHSDVTVTVVRMDDRVHIVARSDDDVVDVSRLMIRFNGGGHHSAASAVVKDGSVETIVSELKELLKESVRPEVVAETIMTTPVKMVSLDKSIDEAAKILLRYGHTGLPVVEDHKLVGIISRRDIEKATHHGLGHAPVKGFMSRKVISIARQTPVLEIQRLMIDHDIGRLPVIDDDRIIGIVSRTDVLRTVHGESYPGRYERVYNITQPIVCVGDNIAELMANLPQKIRNLLGQISFLADTTGFSVFAAGGFVRDLILGVENLDIDLVVEGDGPAFAQKLADFLFGRVRIHEKFGTAMVILPDKFRIDVATARTEYYEFPAALPKVEESTIKQDLYRRDFTINAMAITLSNKNFGHVIDYFGGRRDLNEGIIRVLYNLSFVEDPTRMLRAIRFEQRYNFKIESQTLDLARNAIKSKMLTKLSTDRVREELKHILGESAPLGAVLRMKELNIWPFILEEVSIGQRVVEVIKNIPAAIEVVKTLRDCEINTWLIYLAALVRESGCSVSKINEELRLTRIEQAILENLLCMCPDRTKKLAIDSQMSMSEIASLLTQISNEGLVYVLASTSDKKVCDRIKDYLKKSRYNKLQISGEDIIGMGYSPGPIFKKALDAARIARMDEIITTRDEELAFVKKFLTENEESHRRL